MPDNDPRVIIALDYAEADDARRLVRQLRPGSCRLKVGKELFTGYGPDLVREFIDLGFDVFLDLKFHDIPTTVQKAVAVATRLGVWMLNVHALGGRKMMQAAREGVESGAGEGRPLLIAVSILTSTDQQALGELGIQKSIQQSVLDLTALSLQSGLDGMVCSALEAGHIRHQFGQDPLLVTPGIRPHGASNDDQHRIMTPQRAIAAGSSYLVIGRPITQHDSPAQELERINQALTAPDTAAGI